MAPPEQGRARSAGRLMGSELSHGGPGMVGKMQAAGDTGGDAAARRSGLLGKAGLLGAPAFAASGAWGQAGSSEAPSPYTAASHARRAWSAHPAPTSPQSATERIFTPAGLQRPSSALDWTPPAAQVSGSHRKVHAQALARKSAEELAMELMQSKEALQQAQDEIRVLGTERRRLQAQLLLARSNVSKAEELLNNRERQLSPTQGLSQMYRSPDTTHLVGRLRERVLLLTEERDRLLEALTAAKMDVRATRLAEAQCQVTALTHELVKQQATNALMAAQLNEAKALAAQAATQSASAMEKLKQFMRQGESQPKAPPRVAPSGSLSASKFRQTLDALRQAHTALLSQAQVIRALFPANCNTMDAFDRLAAAKTATIGAGDVLRMLRAHLKKLAGELRTLPGAYAAVDEVAGLDQRGVRLLPLDCETMVKVLGEHVRLLRTLDPAMLRSDAGQQLEVEAVGDMAGQVVAEACRLIGQLGRRPAGSQAPAPDQQRSSPLGSSKPRSRPAAVSSFTPPLPAGEEEVVIFQGRVTDTADSVDVMPPDPHSRASKHPAPVPEPHLARARPRTPEPQEEESGEELPPEVPSTTAPLAPASAGLPEATAPIPGPGSSERRESEVSVQHSTLAGQSSGTSAGAECMAVEEVTDLSPAPSARRPSEQSIASEAAAGHSAGGQKARSASASVASSAAGSAQGLRSKASSTASSASLGRRMSSVSAGSVKSAAPSTVPEAADVASPAAEPQHLLGRPSDGSVVAAPEQADSGSVTSIASAKHSVASASPIASQPGSRSESSATNVHAAALHLGISSSSSSTHRQSSESASSSSHTSSTKEQCSQEMGTNSQRVSSSTASRRSSRTSSASHAESIAAGSVHSVASSRPASGPAASMPDSSRRSSHASSTAEPAVETKRASIDSASAESKHSAASAASVHGVSAPFGSHMFVDDALHLDAADAEDVASSPPSERAQVQGQGHVADSQSIAGSDALEPPGSHRASDDSVHELAALDEVPHAVEEEPAELLEVVEEGGSLADEAAAHDDVAGSPAEASGSIAIDAASADEELDHVPDVDTGAHDAGQEALGRSEEGFNAGGGELGHDAVAPGSQGAEELDDEELQAPEKEKEQEQALQAPQKEQEQEEEEDKKEEEEEEEQEQDEEENEEQGGEHPAVDEDAGIQADAGSAEVSGGSLEAVEQREQLESADEREVGSEGQEEEDDQAAEEEEEEGEGEEEEEQEGAEEAEQDEELEGEEDGEGEEGQPEGEAEEEDGVDMDPDNDEEGGSAVDDGADLEAELEVAEEDDGELEQEGAEEDDDDSGGVDDDDDGEDGSAAADESVAADEQLEEMDGAEPDQQGLETEEEDVADGELGSGDGAGTTDVGQHTGPADVGQHTGPAPGSGNAPPLLRLA